MRRILSQTSEIFVCPKLIGILFREVLVRIVEAQYGHIRGNRKIAIADDPSFTTFDTGQLWHSS